MIIDRFVIDYDLLKKYILKECIKTEKKAIDILIKERKGYLSSFSISQLNIELSKENFYIKNNYLKEIVKKFIIWKTPSYIDFEHPLFIYNTGKYLLHLTAKSLGGIVLSNDEELLKLSDSAFSVEDFLLLMTRKKIDKIDFLDLSSQSIKLFPYVEEDWDNIINSASFVCGKNVKSFERKFADFLGVNHCIGVNSGTSALLVALMAIGVGPEDEVIIPVNTFIATAEAVAILGGIPVFVDIHPDYYTIDVWQIENMINKKTKAIIPVHLYGQCADMEPIMGIAKKYNLWVIEDACQAHGAEYKGNKAGTIGDIGCFSFYPGKNLGAWGEGGACVTNNKELADKMYKIRNHGGIKKYQHDILGGNFRMEEFQGIILEKKLDSLEQWNSIRERVACWYGKFLSELELNKKVKLPKVAEYNTKHVFHLYVIQILEKNRNELINILNKYNIGTGVHYPYTLNQIFSNFDEFYKINSSFYIAEKISNKILSLPIGEHITKNNVEFIANKVKKFFED